MRALHQKVHLLSLNSKVFFFFCISSGNNDMEVSLVKAIVNAVSHEGCILPMELRNTLITKIESLRLHHCKLPQYYCTGKYWGKNTGTILEYFNTNTVTELQACTSWCREVFYWLCILVRKECECEPWWLRPKAQNNNSMSCDIYLQPP